MQAREQGLTRQIGVSSFTIDLMKQAIAAVGTESIATNQIEMHPFLQNCKVWDFARGRNIHITSYMTPAYGKAVMDPVIQRISERHRATPAQVALAWALQLGWSVIPSSTKPTHLEAISRPAPCA